MSKGVKPEESVINRALTSLIYFGGSLFKVEGMLSILGASSPIPDFIYVLVHIRVPVVTGRREELLMGLGLVLIIGNPAFNLSTIDTHCMRLLDHALKSFVVFELHEAVTFGLLGFEVYNQVSGHHISER